MENENFFLNSSNFQTLLHKSSTTMEANNGSFMNWESPIDGSSTPFESVLTNNANNFPIPLNPSSQLNLSIMDYQVRLSQPFSGNLTINQKNWPTMESDPGFTEGVAKFSSFINGNYPEYCNKLRYPTTDVFRNLSEENNLTRVSCNPTVKNVFENLEIKLKDELVIDPRTEPAVGKLEYEEFCRKCEDSSGSDQIAVMETSLKENSEKDARKRKLGHRCKGKDTTVSSSDNYPQEAENGNSSNAKRCRSGDSPENAKELNTVDTSFTTQNCSDSNQKQEKENAKSTEAPKQDYIHVRARRGQATDSHSLAERVRREKISERMKFLQDLVPGCSKVTGKAVMLDEIINHVQSLQRQVEFLSMKLASVNPRLEINMATLLSKDTCRSLSHTKNPVDISSSASPTFSCSNYPQQTSLRTTVTNNVENQYTVNPSNSYVLPHISLERYCESLPQVGNFWADDLQSIVQMGLAPNSQLAFATQRLNGTMPLPDMKLEL